MFIGSAQSFNSADGTSMDCKLFKIGSAPSHVKLDRHFILCCKWTSLHYLGPSGPIRPYLIVVKVSIYVA